MSGEARLASNGTTAKPLTELAEGDWRTVRGREIAVIFQAPMTSLNPLMRIGPQIEEAIVAHEPAAPYTREPLAAVPEIPRPAEV